MRLFLPFALRYHPPLHHDFTNIPHEVFTQSLLISEQVAVEGVENNGTHPQNNHICQVRQIMTVIVTVRRAIKLGLALATPGLPLRQRPTNFLMYNGYHSAWTGS